MQRLALTNDQIPKGNVKLETRVGYGWDSHEFKRGIPLKIGGVTLSHPKGLGGHSDGDVLLHALTDALLGAVAAPDIGWTQVPGAESNVAEALKRVTQAGYVVLNVDSTLILASPKIGPHATAIRTQVADLLGIRPDCVGLKAKTPEGMGTDNAAIAHSVVLLQRKQANKSRSATRARK